MQRYVVGFCFDTELEHVAIVKKNRPDYQAGLFNGIGGKIEFREIGKAAMEREFYEETGVRIDQNTWTHFGDKSDGKNFLVKVYYATSSNVFECKTVEDEEIFVVPVADIDQYNFFDDAKDTLTRCIQDAKLHR